MSTEFILFLKEDVFLTENQETNQLILKSARHSCKFKRNQPGLKSVLDILLSGGATLTKLNEMIQQDDEKFVVLKFYLCLQKFADFGWLCHGVTFEGEKIAVAIPMTPDSKFISAKIDDLAQYRLSPFAYCHQVNRQMVLESPLSRTRILLIGWQATTILAPLSQGLTFGEVATKIPSLESETIKHLMNLLLSTQMLSEVSKDGSILEENDVNLKSWEFHDLLFHARSRIGRHDHLVGKTGKINSFPAIKPKVSEQVVELYRPNLNKLKRSEVSFTQILETRRSIREYGKLPITVEQLGEFLYRCARVKHILTTPYGELPISPYPSGGAIYELELYPLVNSCQGISAGLYHYQPFVHELCLISEKTEVVEDLLNDSRRAMNQEVEPQVLIIIAARFQRIACSYKSIAYALVLKHVGVVYQTMYLVATAMELAPCGLGYGNSDQFARATGYNYYAETSVGEFALGSKP